MKFNESNIVEARLRDVLAGAATARPAQPSRGLARRIAGLGWHYIAPADLPLFGVRSSSVTGFGRHL